MVTYQHSQRSVTRNDEPVQHHNDEDTNFGIQRFKGNIAQGIIELIFRDSGYDVYPYGYENHVFNNIKHMRKGPANTSTKILRTSPDFFMYDRNEDEGYFLEVKFTNASENYYKIAKRTLDSYKSHWEEAFLVVYCARTGNIFCKQFRTIDTEHLKTSGFKSRYAPSYVLNLVDDFEPLPTCFKSINAENLHHLMSSVKDVFEQL